MTENVWRIVTVAGSPLFIVPGLIAVVAAHGSSGVLPLTVLLLFFFVLPWGTAYVFSHVGILETWEANNRVERGKLLPVTSIYAVTGALLLLFTVDTAPLLTRLAVTGAILAVTQLAVNRYWKISFHTIAWGVLTGVATALYGRGIGAATFLAAVPVGYSRVRLKRHTQMQTVAGYILGAGVTLVVFFS